jgi:hypothetical protein
LSVGYPTSFEDDDRGFDPKKSNKAGSPFEFFFAEFRWRPFGQDVLLVIVVQLKEMRRTLVRQVVPDSAPKND